MDEMKKYIIEFSEDPHTIRLIKIKNGDECPATEFKTVTPYTEPDMEKVREEVYEDGYKTAKVQCNIQAEKDLREVGERHYQKGLSDAWEAARKIAVSVPLGGMSQLAIKRMFGVEWQYVLMNCTPATVIEKIRQHEQEQKQEEEQIQVGDEVEAVSGKAVVVYVDDVDEHKVRYVYSNGVYAFNYIDKVTKTGRHFPEIAEVLAKMKEES